MAPFGHGQPMSATHYNLDYLQQVFQGNDAMVLRILDIFEEEVPKYFAEMARLGAVGQWRSLHPLAHKAKSSIGMLGMQALLTSILQVETLSRSGTDDKALAEHLEEAQGLFVLALDALRQDRSEHAVSVVQGAARHAARPPTRADLSGSTERRMYRA